MLILPKSVCAEEILCGYTVISQSTNTWGVQHLDTQILIVTTASDEIRFDAFNKSSLLAHTWLLRSSWARRQCKLSSRTSRTPSLGRKGAGEHTLPKREARSFPFFFCTAVPWAQWGQQITNWRVGPLGEAYARAINRSTCG